jgi:DNA replication protein DnaC
MNIIELQRALRQLRLGGMADVLEIRLRQAQAETMPPIDLISVLISDELTRRADRLLERRRELAGFRDPDKTLDNFDFAFNPNRCLVFALPTVPFIVHQQARARSVSRAEGDKSHLSQATSQSAIHRCHEGLYRETNVLLDELGGAIAGGTRKNTWTQPLEIIVRYERFSTLPTSNLQVEERCKPLDAVAAVSEIVHRCYNYGHVLECGPRLAHQHGHTIRRKSSIAARAPLAWPQNLPLFSVGMNPKRRAAPHSGISVRVPAASLHCRIFAHVLSV